MSEWQLLRRFWQLTIKARDDGEFKAEWSAAYRSVGSYPLNKDALEDIGKDVRATLDQLVEQALTEGIDACDEHLQKLADAGTDLYSELFPRTQPAAVSCRDTLEEATKDETSEPAANDRLFLLVRMESAIHIPWSLVRRPEPVPDGRVAMEHLDPFWCLSYRLAVSKDIPLVGDSPSTVKLLLLPLFDSDVYKALAKRADMTALTPVLKATNSMIIDSRDALDKYVRRLPDAGLLVYFLGHSSAEGLVLGNKERDFVSARHLRRILMRLGENPGIVFINGCRSAAGGSPLGHFDQVFDAGAVGLIGTEAKVPSLFAWRFGLEFLRRFLGTGKEVAEVMENLRKTHWPMSLLYSAYCSPYFRAAEYDIPSEGPSHNYSDLLGEDTI